MTDDNKDFEEMSKCEAFQFINTSQVSHISRLLSQLTDDDNDVYEAMEKLEAIFQIAYMYREQIESFQGDNDD